MTPLHYGILSSRRRVAWLGVVVFLMLTAVASAQDLAVPGPGPVGPASERDVRAGAARIGEIIEPPPRRGYTEDVWTKRAPVHASASQPAAVPAENQAAAAAPGLIATFDGVDFSGSIPPDGAIAAGPSTLILVTNGSLTIRDKGGNLIASTALTSFFAAVRQAAESSFDLARSTIPAAAGSSCPPPAR
jgi:hypothetical protein